MSVATSGAPLRRGFTPDSFSWRWIFYINLPIGGAALAYLAVTPKLPKRPNEHPGAYPGAALPAGGAAVVAGPPPEVRGAGWLAGGARGLFPGGGAGGGGADPAAARVPQQQ